MSSEVNKIVSSEYRQCKN